MHAQSRLIDLNKVANREQFKIPDSARALLERNGFALQQGRWEQPFFIYEENVYLNVPHFITLDSVLHLYHLFFQFALRTLEERALAPRLAQFTRRLLTQCIQTYRQAPTPELRDAALRNVAYVGVAARLQSLNDPLPEPALSMVRKELELIRAHSKLEVGAILPYAIDYSQFIVRGHYTRTATLQRYFRAMMWYGLFPFAPKRLLPGMRREPTPVPVRQALLLTDALYRANLVNVWQQLMTPIDFFVGGVDDLTPPEVRQIAERIYGKNPTLRSYADSKRFEAFFAEFLKVRLAGIRPKFLSMVGELPPLPDPDSPQMRLLGQRYIPDSEVLQSLSDPLHRPIPSGLDVMAVLGSARAKTHLDAKPAEWNQYLPTRRTLTERFAALDKREWTRNLYWGWLWALQSIVSHRQENLPAVFRTPAWQDKCLQTALASWAQLRHNTILYGKQSVVGAEGDGDGLDIKFTRDHYVEPNLEAWQRLLELTRMTKKLPFLDSFLRDKLDNLESITAFLGQIARLRLEGKPLTEDDQIRLRFIGGEMDSLAVQVVSGGAASCWFEITHPADRRMACIADVHTAFDRKPDGLGNVALEVGVGWAHEIFVVVPVEGRLALTRGASFSYYEFLQPVNKRLTDEQWQRLLGAEDLETGEEEPEPAPRTRTAPHTAPPPQPDWIRPLYLSEPIEIVPPKIGTEEDEG
ncbi:MAG: DUF3160 domain-containing protein [Fimbriimonadales bacterium]|nr:DUF3160 domain-containing protein [Fimbriimonadales bacterium]